MDKFTTTNASSDDRKILAESTAATVNKKRGPSDAIEANHTKKTKKAGFDLSTATPPSFLADIILPDEDEVQFTRHLGLIEVWYGNL